MKFTHAQWSTIFTLQMKANTCEKRSCTPDIKGKYVAHIRPLKQSLNHGLILKRVSKTIKFNLKD